MAMDKKSALVTGGSRGIGLGIAVELAKAGYDIVINGRRPIEDVQPSIDAIEKHGVDVMYCPADVASPEGREQLLTDIQEHLGRLDVLVNNAGVAPTERKDLLEADPDSFDRLMQINLKGPYFLTQLFANWMIAQQRAGADERPGYRPIIINVGSISATVVSTNRGEYCLSKAGVAMATQLWAARLAEFGIDVFEIRPGIIETDMTAGVKEKYDKLLTETDMLVQKRWGQPEDIGKAAAVLARGEIRYGTGTVLTLDGGLTLQRL